MNDMDKEIVFNKEIKSQIEIINGRSGSRDIITKYELTKRVNPRNKVFFGYILEVYIDYRFFVLSTETLNLWNERFSSTDYIIEVIDDEEGVDMKVTFYIDF